ncbi:hypothetical protein HZS_1652 [Henneguya salminicola]|nr:hypothetical protein HZS_1652 [Henneguya salminicola]
MLRIRIRVLNFLFFRKKGSLLSSDITTRIIEAYNRGNSCHKMAELFDHNRTTVHNIVKLYLLTGVFENKATRLKKWGSKVRWMKIVRSIKTISSKYMYEFGVRICKLIAKSILT